MLFEKIQLEEDEKILQTIHRHWFVVFSHAASISLVAAAPLAGWITISILTQKAASTLPVDLSAYTAYFVFFYSFWLLVCWMTFIHVWTTQFLDVWVLTTRRVIVIEQVSLFRRRLGSFRLEKLQDVNIEIDGILPTFLNYGTVEAETASGSHDAEFRTTHLPHPRDIKAIILKAADDLMEAHIATQNTRNDLQ